MANWILRAEGTTDSARGFNPGNQVKEGPNDGTSQVVLIWVRLVSFVVLLCQAVFADIRHSAYFGAASSWVE